MKNITIMLIPQNFKIRRKDDIKTFTEKCMQKDNSYYLMISKEKAIIMNKDKYGNISFAVKMGDLNDIFNPSIEVACTDRPDSYKNSVDDYIWEFRKYINEKWFSGKEMN